MSQADLHLPVPLDQIITVGAVQVVASVDTGNLSLFLKWIVDKLNDQQEKAATLAASVSSISNDKDSLREAIRAVEQQQVCKLKRCAVHMHQTTYESNRHTCAQAETKSRLDKASQQLSEQNDGLQVGTSQSLRSIPPLVTHHLSGTFAQRASCARRLRLALWCWCRGYKACRVSWLQSKQKRPKTEKHSRVWQTPWPHWMLRSSRFKPWRPIRKR
jgi:hypothetical protein